MGGFGEDVTFNSFGICSIGMCEEENIEGRAVYITTWYLPVKYMYLKCMAVDVCAIRVWE